MGLVSVGGCDVPAQQPCSLSLLVQQAGSRLSVTGAVVPPSLQTLTLPPRHTQHHARHATQTSTFKNIILQLNIYKRLIYHHDPCFPGLPPISPHPGHPQPYHACSPSLWWPPFPCILHGAMSNGHPYLESIGHLGSPGPTAKNSSPSLLILESNTCARPDRKKNRQSPYKVPEPCQNHPDAASIWAFLDQFLYTKSELIGLSRKAHLAFCI